MKITNITIDQMEHCLKALNREYNNNIIWKRTHERHGKWLHFTLKAKDSKRKGARRSLKGKRTVAACWRVHWDFFDVVLTKYPNAIIIATIGADSVKIYNDEGSIVNNWIGTDIGNYSNPLLFSEACGCNIDN